MSRNALNYKLILFNMNKTIGVIIGLIVVIGGIYLITRTPKTTTDNTYGTTEDQSTSTTGAKGRVVFSVTDAAVDMKTISEINMKVNSVDVHNNTTGWMTVSTTPRTYSLLSLNARNESELLADIQAGVGTYDQIRLMVDSISVKTKAGATKEAKLPSGELKINTTLVVTADNTASVNFDFLADKSLHTTGNGGYIFAPVVRTESKSDADVSIGTGSVVTIIGGHVDSSNSVGMDVDGSIKLNFQIKSDQKLDLDANNMIKINGLLK